MALLSPMVPALRTQDPPRRRRRRMTRSWVLVLGLSWWSLSGAASAVSSDHKWRRSRTIMSSHAVASRGGSLGGTDHAAAHDKATLTTGPPSLHEEDHNDHEQDHNEQDPSLITATAESTTTVAVLDKDLLDAPISGSAPLRARQLRADGKEHHDRADFHEAAALFGAAAELLQGYRPDQNHQDPEGLLEEWATCRLHEALCRLKAHEYDLAIQACTQVLDWNRHNDKDETAYSNWDVAPAIRARAFHRRAKAYMELGQEERALADARSAAFLGDRKAVALYGKLMRSSSSSTSTTSSSSSSVGSQASTLSDLLAWGSSTESFSPSSTGSLLESLLGASSPLASVDDTRQATTTTTSQNNMFLPNSLLDFGKATPGGKGSGSLAKSVLASLTKRLENEETQNMICSYLQSTSGPQLQQMASMAGVPLQPSQAHQIASLMNRATPRTIQRTITFTRRSIYVVQLIRKLHQLAQKYRNWIILFCLLAWIKSAVLRPLPVRKQPFRGAAAKAMARGML